MQNQPEHAGLQHTCIIIILLIYYRGSLGWPRDHFTPCVAVLATTNRQFRLWFAVPVEPKLAVCSNASWLPVTGVLSFPPIEPNPCITSTALQVSCEVNLIMSSVHIWCLSQMQCVATDCFPHVETVCVYMHTYVSAYVWRWSGRSEGLAQKYAGVFLCEVWLFVHTKNYYSCVSANCKTLEIIIMSIIIPECDIIFCVQRLLIRPHGNSVPKQPWQSAPLSLLDQYATSGSWLAVGRGSLISGCLFFNSPIFIFLHFL